MHRKSGRLQRKTKTSPDYLTPLLNHGPLGWVIIRANELKALECVDFKNPILDVGCGDGMVAKVFFGLRKQKVDWGIDISQSELDNAKKTDVYKNLVIASVYSLPFEESSFNTVFSNSVMEHIQKLDQALSEISRVLKKQGNLIITVPTPYISKYLLASTIFNRLGLRIFSKWYGDVFNKMFKHYNLYDYREWEKIMKKHSLQLINHEYYHSSKLIKMHEVLTFISIPGQIVKNLTGTWPRLHVFSSLFRTQLLNFLADNYKNQKGNEGASVLLIARKI